MKDQPVYIFFASMLLCFIGAILYTWSEYGSDAATNILLFKFACVTFVAGVIGLIYNYAKS